MRYAAITHWIPKQINSKWFYGNNNHDFSYKYLHEGIGYRVSYGGQEFACKQDAKRNLNRMLNEYRDHEFIEGQNHAILLELAGNAYPGQVPSTTRFAKVEDRALLVYFIDLDGRQQGCCFPDDFISAM